MTDRLMIPLLVVLGPAACAELATAAIRCAYDKAPGSWSDGRYGIWLAAVERRNPEELAELALEAHELATAWRGSARRALRTVENALLVHANVATDGVHDRSVAHLTYLTLSGLTDAVARHADEVRSGTVAERVADAADAADPEDG